MRNWTDTLRARNAGQVAGFSVPANLDKLSKGELEELAEDRGIDPTDLKKDELAAAIRGT